MKSGGTRVAVHNRQEGVRSGRERWQTGASIACEGKRSDQMLRITVTTWPEGTEVTLEGRVVGPWAAELVSCWQRLGATARRPIRVDLDCVTFVDAAGKAALQQIYADGAVFTASGVLMRAVAEEIASNCRDHRDR